MGYKKYKMKIILNSAAACSRGASLILVFPTISPLLLILIRILIAVLFVLLTWHFVREFILSFARCKLHLCDYGHLASSSLGFSYGIWPFKRCSRDGGSNDILSPSDVH